MEENGLKLDMSESGTFKGRVRKDVLSGTRTCQKSVYLIQKHKISYYFTLCFGLSINIMIYN